jgi:hypothetical protein
MSSPTFTGLFVAEGSSDAPLAAIVESLFLERGFIVRLSAPDFSRLERTPKDVRSRVSAGLALLESGADVVVVHRDADNVGAEERLREIERAVLEVGQEFALISIIPIRMTEAWLLLDERAIRQVAGNPNGRVKLDLPTLREVERVADPKTRLRDCLLAASDTTGRRRDMVRNRFPQHRRQLLERLDPNGPVASLKAWKTLVDAVDQVAVKW